MRKNESLESALTILCGDEAAKSSFAPRKNVLSRSERRLSGEPQLLSILPEQEGEMYFPGWQISIGYRTMNSDEQLDALSQETKLTILLNPDAGATVPVDIVCEQLFTEFPGAVITAQNSFAAKRLFIEHVRNLSQERLRVGKLEPWEFKTMTMNDLNRVFDLGIADNRRVELRSGPKKDLAIPLSNGTQLKGHVGAKSIRFRGSCRRSDVTVANLVRFLEFLNIGKVEILDHGPNPSYWQE